MRYTISFDVEVGPWCGCDERHSKHLPGCCFPSEEAVVEAFGGFVRNEVDNLHDFLITPDGESDEVPVSLSVEDYRPVEPPQENPPTAEGKCPLPPMGFGRSYTAALMLEPLVGYYIRIALKGETKPTICRLESVNDDGGTVALRLKEQGREGLPFPVTLKEVDSIYVY